MASQVRMNYHEDCEASINKQVNMELYASYVYMSMSYFFDRDDVALPGMRHFFKEMSDEEREHAEKLMKLQNKRGGRVVLQAINAPTKQEWGNAHDALTTALELERQVNQSLLDIHGTASRTNDPHLTDFLEREFLEEQVSSIKKLGDMITQLKRTGTSGLGEYLFDQNQKS